MRRLRSHPQAPTLQGWLWVGVNSPSSSPLSRPPCLSLPFTEGSWANCMPMGEVESGWVVRRLRSHPQAPTLQDLWVLFLPLGPLDCSRVPMGSVSLLPSWPQNSGVRASHTSPRVSDLKELPTPCLLSQGRNWAQRGLVTARGHTASGWQRKRTPGL